MPKLPVVSGAKAVEKFERLGYFIIRQKGSHVRLIINDSNRLPLSVPLHRTLKPGLLSDLIKDANLSIQEFINL